MADKMPAELLEKFAKDREAKKAPSGDAVSGSEESRKRAKAKAKKAKECIFRKLSFFRVFFTRDVCRWPARLKLEKGSTRS